MKNKKTFTELERFKAPEEFSLRVKKFHEETMIPKSQIFRKGTELFMDNYYKSIQEKLNSSQNNLIHA